MSYLMWVLRLELIFSFEQCVFLLCLSLTMLSNCRWWGLNLLMWGLQGSALKDQNVSGIGVHTFDSTTWGSGKQISEFQVSLCYEDSLYLLYLFFKELKESEPLLLEGLAESKVSVTFWWPFRNPKTAIHHVQITTKKWCHEGSPQVGIQLCFICRQHFHQVG